MNFDISSTLGGEDLLTDTVLSFVEEAETEELGRGGGWVTGGADMPRERHKTFIGDP